MIVQKGGQVTEPIIVVKMPCKLLYVSKKCSTSWACLISEILIAYNHCCLRLALHIFTARLFLVLTVGALIIMFHVQIAVFV